MSSSGHEEHDALVLETFAQISILLNAVIASPYDLPAPREERERERAFDWDFIQATAKPTSQDTLKTNALYCLKLGGKAHFDREGLCFLAPAVVSPHAPSQAKAFCGQPLTLAKGPHVRLDFDLAMFGVLACVTWIVCWL